MRFSIKVFFIFIIVAPYTNFPLHEVDSWYDREEGEGFIDRDMSEDDDFGSAHESYKNSLIDLGKRDTSNEHENLKLTKSAVDGNLANVNEDFLDEEGSRNTDEKQKLINNWADESHGVSEVKVDNNRDSYGGRRQKSLNEAVNYQNIPLRESESAYQDSGEPIDEENSNLRHSNEFQQYQVGLNDDGYENEESDERIKRQDKSSRDKSYSKSKIQHGFQTNRDEQREEDGLGEKVEDNFGWKTITDVRDQNMVENRRAKQNELRQAPDGVQDFGNNPETLEDEDGMLMMKFGDHENEIDDGSLVKKYEIDRYKREDDGEDTENGVNENYLMKNDEYDQRNERHVDEEMNMKTRNDDQVESDYPRLKNNELDRSKREEGYDEDRDTVEDEESMMKNEFDDRDKSNFQDDSLSMGTGNERGGYDSLSENNELDERNVDEDLKTLDCENDEFSDMDNGFEERNKRNDYDEDLSESSMSENNELRLDERDKREDEDEQLNMKTGSDEGNGDSGEDEENMENLYDDFDRENENDARTNFNPKRYIKQARKEVPIDGTGAKIWDEWNKWQPCSTTCGVGKRTRWRHCVGGECASGEKEAQIKRCSNPAC